MAATTIEPNTGGERPSGKANAEPASPAKARLYWRAVVRTGGQMAGSRERDRVEWHLAACRAPTEEGSHCTEGRHLLETVGHPDGHCIVENNVCGLCGAEAPPAE